MYYTVELLIMIYVLWKLCYTMLFIKEVSSHTAYSHEDNWINPFSTDNKNNNL